MIKKITTTTLSFLLILLIIPKPLYAAFDTTKLVEFFGPFSETSVWTAADEFCQKRSGELMNLETWFSGKCGEDVKSSIQGEGVGFVDIIALQGLESLFAIFKPTHVTFFDYIGKTIDWMQENANLLNGTGYNFKPTPPPFQNTLAGSISSGLSYLFLTKPASTTEYIAYVSNNLKQHKIINNTYAANSTSTGFKALSPLLPIWKAFRNIAYMLFAIAFVMYGIMIMFRIRIDSKTAANITLAIPKLVSTLLLITFSYAIVGLLIDIMNVFMALSIDILRVGGIITSYGNIFIKAVSGQSNVGLIGSLIWNGIVGFLVTPVVILNIIFGGILSNAISSLAIVGGATYAFAPVSISVIFLLFIIFLLALLFAYGKIFFAVLKSYITIVIHLIFSPIIILGNVFPGSKAFSGWIMTIIGNLAVFPVITFFLVLSYALMMQPLANIFNGAGAFGVADLSSSWTGFWTPPMTSLSSTVVSGSSSFNVNNGAAMLALVGLMLLFMASKYADMVLEALKVPPFKYGSAITDSLRWGYNQAGDSQSGYRKSPLGFVASGLEANYTANTGRNFFDDTTPFAGKPNASKK